MKKVYLLLCTLLTSFFLQAQLLTWTPDFAKDNDNITITLDATKGNQGLNNYGNTNDVYVHTGVITNLSTSQTNWLYVKNFGVPPNQVFNTPIPELKATSLGNNKYSFSITNIRAYYGVPVGETILRISILFRNGAGTAVQRNADGSDMYVPIYDNNLAVRFSAPPFEPHYVPTPEPITKLVGDNINLTGIANLVSDMKLYLNGTVIQTATGVTTISANPTLTASGNTEIVVEATAATITKKDTFHFFVSPAVTIAPLPNGVRNGINYAANNTDVTLVLYAPGKTRVTVIGEFPGSNWVEQSQYLMNKTADGNYWWVKITGLTPGTEYAYQYLVDGTLRIADPYAEKILDPFFNNDQNIPSSTYPNLKPYPIGQQGIVSVLQTNEPAYNWVNNSFARPDKRNLFIYELLVRDFVVARDWKTIKDTISYLKRLGVNTIEIMPFNEFEGNNSWGYNPDFYFAPDKFYGPKNTLKEFIDVCHGNGIAVVMDIALNHSFGLSPLVQLYWDAVNNRPAANNPWFNPVAKHAFNVGYDMNHESPATHYYFSRIVEHWLQQYRLDGFRFDLSKGFTQNQTCDNNGDNCNINAMGAYDASRIAIWKGYYDTLQLKSAGSYVILEHFADNAEELELSNYGMMPWGNMAYSFEQASMGYNTGWNFEGGIYSVRGWSKPYLVTYMESHDEERMAYKNIAFGNASGSYTTKDTTISLGRLEICAAFLMSIPGPKMIWQFGELGYDYSINTCTNGTINDSCRLTPKPIRWDYKQQIRRQRLYDIYSSLSRLRYNGWYKDIFTGNNITLTRDLSGAVKWITIRSATDSSELLIVGNFDVISQTGSVTFPTVGTWYDYLKGTTFTATGGAQTMTLVAGEYHVYLNRNLAGVVTTPVIDINNPGDALQLNFYPNPSESNSVAEVFMPEKGNLQVGLWNMQGQKVATVFSGTLAKGKHDLSLPAETARLSPGIYLLQAQTKTKTQSVKILIR
jgi:glycosidase